MSTSGASTPPTLDGLHLIGASADTWEVTETEIVGTIRLANGATREQRLAPLPGHPVIRRWYGVTLDYRHLGPLAEEVEARLAFPGPHDLTLWKHVTLGYLADGQRTEFSVPWRHAPHHLTPPAGAPAARFTATVSTRWCCRQLPEMRRGTMRPRSVKKLRNRPISLKSIGALSTQNRHGLRR
jgi:hypothetical protein